MEDYNMKLLNVTLAVLLMFSSVYSSEVVLEMKHSNNYILTCNNRTKVLDNIEVFAREFNTINNKYLHVNSVNKSGDILVLNGLSSKQSCSFIINGNMNYKPNVKLHITGNANFEQIVGNNTGTVIIDSDTDAEITNMIVKISDNKEISNISDGLLEVKAGGTLKINEPYFKLKFVSKTD